ncbi:terminase [uncultured Salegentibacter sp.]|uniref:terminase n=1 Tax=uncultured Salegentibacter sp. TaxID=259320 RepID=UPI002594E79F|nr:terminase [uncultured Salegentibacter sp.]
MAAERNNKYAEGEGRPSKYEESMNDLAYKYCLLGATDAQLGKLFDVDERTINNWKKQHPSFFQSITQGKEISDLEVAQSLYKGTQDRIVTEQQAFKVKEVSWNEEGKRIETERIELVDIEKTIPGDFRNQQFWLKNRRPKNWRDTQNIDHTTGGEKLNKQLDLSKLSVEELKSLQELQNKAKSSDE